MINKDDVPFIFMSDKKLIVYQEQYKSLLLNKNQLDKEIYVITRKCFREIQYILKNQLNYSDKLIEEVEVYLEHNELKEPNRNKEPIIVKRISKEYPYRIDSDYTGEKLSLKIKPSFSNEKSFELVKYHEEYYINISYGGTCWEKNSNQELIDLCFSVNISPELYKKIINYAVLINYKMYPEHLMGLDTTSYEIRVSNEITDIKFSWSTIYNYFEPLDRLCLLFWLIGKIYFDKIFVIIG